jgi:hypothetical protein
MLKRWVHVRRGSTQYLPRPRHTRTICPSTLVLATLAQPLQVTSISNRYLLLHANSLNSLLTCFLALLLYFVSLLAYVEHRLNSNLQRRITLLPASLCCTALRTHLTFRVQCPVACNVLSVLPICVRTLHSCSSLLPLSGKLHS